MIEIIKGNLLESNANIICQQVNCCGVMGAGLAKQIRDKYPEVYDNYKYTCISYDALDLLGKVICTPVEENIKIASIFGQLNYGRNKNKVYTDYNALKKGLDSIKDRFLIDKKNVYKDTITIGIPYNIGCGLANGNWEIVYAMINRIFREHKDRVKIYKI